MTTREPTFPDATRHEQCPVRETKRAFGAKSGVHLGSARSSPRMRGRPEDDFIGATTWQRPNLC